MMSKGLFSVISISTFSSSSSLNVNTDCRRILMPFPSIDFNLVLSVPILSNFSAGYLDLNVSKKDFFIKYQVDPESHNAMAGISFTSTDIRVIYLPDLDSKTEYAMFGLITYTCLHILHNSNCFSISYLAFGFSPGQHLCKADVDYISSIISPIRVVLSGSWAFQNFCCVSDYWIFFLIIPIALVRSVVTSFLLSRSVVHFHSKSVLFF